MSAAEFPLSDELPVSPPPGEQLAAARQSRGMTIGEIAQQLKLSPWQVAALEAGDHQRLPGTVFVRGFMRNYARLVKLDPATLLDAGQHQSLRAAPLAMSSSAEIPYPNLRRTRWLKYVIAAIILLVPLVIYEFYFDGMPESDVKSSELGTPAAQVVVDTAAPPASLLVVAAPAATAPSASEKAAPREVKNTVPSARVFAVGRGEPPPEQVVRLRFSRESWVEIRDRDGNTIFSKMNSAGTEQVVSGAPPLHVVVGNANGVQLIHKEQPVNLGPYTKVDVARLTLE
jgi:cytoskeleton protein RodZ